MQALMSVRTGKGREPEAALVSRRLKASRRPAWIAGGPQEDPASRPSGPAAQFPQRLGSQMGLQCGEKGASSKQQMGELTMVGREVCLLQLCPPTPMEPQGKRPQVGPTQVSLV